MAILSGIPVFHCRSIEDTLVFYQQMLQFVLVNKRDLAGRLVWAHLMHGDTTLMLQSAEDSSAEPCPANNSNISYYFFVDNIDALHHLIKAKNHPVSAIETRDYQMREFNLNDPENNKIIIGQKG